MLLYVSSVSVGGAPHQNRTQRGAKRSQTAGTDHEQPRQQDGRKRRATERGTQNGDRTKRQQGAGGTDQPNSRATGATSATGNSRTASPTANRHQQTAKPEKASPQPTTRKAEPTNQQTRTKTRQTRTAEKTKRANNTRNTPRNKKVHDGETRKPPRPTQTQKPCVSTQLPAGSTQRNATFDSNLSVRRTFEPTLATRFQRGRTQPARDSARARSAATQRRLCRRAKQNQGSPPTDGATAVFCDSPLARTATCIMKRPAAALCDRARRLPHSGAGFTGPCKSFLTHPAPSA